MQPSIPQMPGPQNREQNQRTFQAAEFQGDSSHTVAAERPPGQSPSSPLKPCRQSDPANITQLYPSCAHDPTGDPLHSECNQVLTRACN